jgi:peptide/nickel transport system permease protein
LHRYIIRRLFRAGLVLIGVSLVVFLLLHSIGDPIVLLLGQDASQEQIDYTRKQMGLDDPIYVQYARFLWGLVHLEFGKSIRTGEPALKLVLERIPATVELTAAAMMLSIMIALPVGIIAALNRNRLQDGLVMLFALIGQSMAGFWLGIMLILIFSVKLNLLPAAGRETLLHLILPAVTLSTFSMARLARLTRSGMVEVMEQDYIRTARSKGLIERAVVMRHAIKNALIPIVTVLGLDLGTMLGGAVITETVFAWPGVGLLAYRAILGRDYPVVQGIVIVVAAGYVFVNLAVDLLYSYLNPRIRYD